MQKLDNTMMKDKEKVERPVKKESAFYEEKKTETSVEKREVLKLDLEKPCHDMGCNQQAKATISKLEKAGNVTFKLVKWSDHLQGFYG